MKTSIVCTKLVVWTMNYIVVHSCMNYSCLNEVYVWAFHMGSSSTGTKWWKLQTEVEHQDGSGRSREQDHWRCLGYLRSVRCVARYSQRERIVIYAQCHIKVKNSLYCVLRANRNSGKTRRKHRHEGTLGHKVASHFNKPEWTRESKKGDSIQTSQCIIFLYRLYNKMPHKGP